MDQQLESRSKRKVTIAAILGLILALIIWGVVADSNQRASDRERIATAEGIARVVDAVFRERSDLKVATLSGKIDVRSVNQGEIFRTGQRSKIPFSVDYFVDLSAINQADVRYDGKTRTMIVEVSPVRVAAPNIDETGKIIIDREGWWTSRDAAEKLAIRASKLAGERATLAANDPTRLRAAQDSARRKVADLMRLPLNAAGLDDVNIVVRFPTEGFRDGERWDVSPSIAEVLAKQAGR
jgi:hypothetical protein